MTRNHAIPTLYGGIRFRSRLEARWSFMFDRLGWRWEYEPVDLKGYIPDFVLQFPAGPMLVEIKPAFSVGELIRSAASKIDQAGWTSANLNDALILGATVAPSSTCDDSVGALRQNPSWGEEANEAEWTSASWILCNSCRRPALYPPDLLWRCTACGTYEQHTFNDRVKPALETAWREAGNAVRWEGRRAA